MTVAAIDLARMGEYPPVLPPVPPRLFVYSGQSKAEALDAARRGQESRTGPARLVIVAEDGQQNLQKTTAALAWLDGRGLRPRGVAFRSEPAGGEVAFVFGGGGVDYRGMGADLIRTFPRLAAPVCAEAKDWISHASWVYQDEPAEVPMVGRLLGMTFLSYVHSRFTMLLLGLHPQAVMGVSIGEVSAINALDAWVDPMGLIRDTESSAIYRQDLAGEFRSVRAGWTRQGISAQLWENHLVGTPAEVIKQQMVPGEPVYLTARCSPEAALVGGDPAACQRLITAVNAPYAIKLDYDLASHADVVADAETALLELYSRPMHPLHGVRAYSTTMDRAYLPGIETTPRVIAAQARASMDFVAMVEQAYADGVRVFVEHGPGRVCTGWIGQILAGRSHVAVAIDGDLAHLSSVVAELVAASVWHDPEAFFGHLVAPEVT